MLRLWSAKSALPINSERSIDRAAKMASKSKIENISDNPDDVKGLDTERELVQR